MMLKGRWTVSCGHNFQAPKLLYKTGSQIGLIATLILKQKVKCLHLVTLSPETVEPHPQKGSIMLSVFFKLKAEGFFKYVWPFRGHKTLKG